MIVGWIVIFAISSLYQVHADILINTTISSNSSHSISRILFIGNSYTERIHRTFQSLVLHQQPKLLPRIQFIDKGGATLRQYSHAKKVHKTISRGKWDIVVLQEQSETPAVYPQWFRQGAEDLHQYIQESGAITVLYETWAHEWGDSLNPESMPSHEIMFQKISSAYQQESARMRAVLSPVGLAWELLRASNESVGELLYAPDGSHPSKYGAFLSSCVLYSTIFDIDPREIDFSSRIRKETRNLLQFTAWKAFDQLGEHFENQLEKH